MSSLDIQSLLQPIAPDAPCGENLEYDAAYAGMERAAVGKPEQQFGDTVIPAEEPDWREVKQKALDVLKRSKDLRVALYLTRSALRTDGLQGLADGTAVLKGLIEKFWDSVHPQLDPDDDNDPATRVNTIASLCDPVSILRGVRDATLVRSRGMGSFTYRDILTAQGELPPPTGAAKPEMSSIEGAFSDCDVKELQATAEAVRDAQANVTGIEDSITEFVGSSSAPNLDDLTGLLRTISRFLKDRLSQRGINEPSADKATDESPGEAAPVNGDSAGKKNGDQRASAPIQRLTGEIASREDVIRAIDKICDYYKRYEPSSPVPLFLNRAKRLASKSFLDILRDLTPDALAQALAIGGISDGAEQSVGSDDDL